MTPRDTLFEPTHRAGSEEPLPCIACRFLYTSSEARLAYEQTDAGFIRVQFCCPCCDHVGFGVPVLNYR